MLVMECVTDHRSLGSGREIALSVDPGNSRCLGFAVDVGPHCETTSDQVHRLLSICHRELPPTLLLRSRVLTTHIISAYMG